MKKYEGFMWKSKVVSIIFGMCKIYVHISLTAYLPYLSRAHIQLQCVGNRVFDAVRNSEVAMMLVVIVGFLLVASHAFAVQRKNSFDVVRTGEKLLMRAAVDVLISRFEMIFLPQRDTAFFAKRFELRIVGKTSAEVP